VAAVVSGLQLVRHPVGQAGGKGKGRGDAQDLGDPDLLPPLATDVAVGGVLGDLVAELGVEGAGVVAEDGVEDDAVLATEARGQQRPERALDTIGELADAGGGVVGADAQGVAQLLVVEALPDTEVEQRPFFGGQLGGRRPDHLDELATRLVPLGGRIGRGLGGLVTGQSLDAGHGHGGAGVGGAMAALQRLTGGDGEQPATELARVAQFVEA
jgi:hypothetical protein